MAILDWRPKNSHSKMTGYFLVGARSASIRSQRKTQALGVFERVWVCLCACVWVCGCERACTCLPAYLCALCNTLVRIFESSL